jgi:hypothetical protein
MTKIEYQVKCEICNKYFIPQNASRRACYECNKKGGKMAKKTDWNYESYHKLTEEKFKLEDDNVNMYHQIRQLKSKRLSNVHAIIKIENAIRAMMGYKAVKQNEKK